MKRKGEVGLDRIFDRANFNSALSAARCKCMRNLFTNPSAPTVDCGVAQVDAVTDLCQLVTGFCGALDRHSHLVQPGLAAEPARIGSQRTTQSFGGVDSFSLMPAVGLYKRTSCCFGERKYFSSTSLIKISDNVHAVS